MNVRHTGLYVNDMEVMERFYREVFRMDIASRQIEEGGFIARILDEPGIRIDVCKLVFPDRSMIELIKVLGDGYGIGEDKKICQQGSMHIAVTVESADEMYGILRKKNCAMLSEPSISPDGKAKVFFTRDPEGNYLEIVEELQYE